jgi:hypothetical protein
MSKRKSHITRPPLASTFMKVRSEDDLVLLERLVSEVITYKHFKFNRTADGHIQYFLGDDIIKGRNRGKCSKGRQPFVKAHTAIWFLTDELEEKAFAIVDRNLSQLST